MFVVTVEFTIISSHLQVFMQAMKHNAEQSLAEEPGCVHFDVCQHNTQQNRIFLYELYHSAEDFQLHLQSTHFLAFDQQITPWLENKKVETWQRS